MSLQERTLVFRNFDHEQLTNNILKELCIQGGPVIKVVIREDHAFVEFEDVESVGYTKALLDGVKLFGKELQIQPRVRSQAYVRYSKALNDYINHVERNRMAQQLQPVVWESQQQQRLQLPPPTTQQPQQQFLVNPQQQFLMDQQQLQLQLQQQQQQQVQSRPTGAFDVYGQFFLQSQQPNNFMPPQNYQPPPTTTFQQDASFTQPNQNYFASNQMPHNNYQQHHQRPRDHSHNNNLGRSRSFNDHHHRSNNNHNNQSNNRRQSAQVPDFKNRRR